MVIRTAIYARQSTDELQEGSTRQQVEELKTYATQNGKQVVQIFEDRGWSGTNFTKRPAFMEMLSLVESKRATFKEILVYDESRWGRGVNPRENSYWKLHFERYGVSVHIMHSASARGNDIGSYVVEVVESAEASEYSKKLSRATLRGAKDNAKQGFSSGGSAPYGYLRIAVNKMTRQKTRILTPGQHANQDEKVLWALGDPREIEVVKRIFEMSVRGMGDKAIANSLNTENIPPPKRGRWRNANRRWAAVTIRTILTNRTYVGERIYNVHPQSHLTGPEKNLWINPTEDWVITPDSHPRIITKETFELANVRRKDYQRLNRFHYDSPYLLSGLIKCSQCGFNYQGQKHSKTKKASYYEDSGYISKGRSVCTSFRISKEKLEEFVVTQIKKRILNSDLPKKLEQLLSQRVKDASTNRVSGLEQFERQLTEVNLKIERLLTLAENGVNLPEQVDKLKQAEKERKELEKTLKELRIASISRQELTNAKDEVRNLMDNFENILRVAPLHIQKELLKKFVYRIVVERKTESVVVYLRKVPMLSIGMSSNPSEVFGLIEVRKKVRTGKHKPQFQKTSETSERSVSVLAEDRLGVDPDPLPVGKTTPETDDTSRQ